MRFLSRNIIIICSFLVVSGCKIAALDIDKCAIVPDPFVGEYCIPTDPKKPEYEKPITMGDICVSPDDYAKLEKHYKELMRRCGDRCE